MIPVDSVSLVTPSVPAIQRLYVRGEAAWQVSCTIYNEEDYQLCGAVQHEDLCTTSKPFANPSSVPFITRRMYQGLVSRSLSSEQCQKAKLISTPPKKIIQYKSEALKL